MYTPAATVQNPMRPGPSTPADEKMDLLMTQALHSAPCCSNEIRITLVIFGQEFLREWWSSDDGGGETERGTERGGVR